jgi:cell division septum initiation protein DivIVA
MTVEETPTPSPRFATVVRGYDRLQVDDYVEHLHRWIEQADYRAQQCEVAATRANSEADQMRRRLASVDAGTLTATPESMKALGDRVGNIMQSSFQAAKDLHRRAEDEARGRAAAAEETATQIIAEATLRAEELSRAAEDLFVQAQEALARADSVASREMDEAKAHAATEGQELLERARNEARELARRTAEEEQVRREQLVVLEEHRTRVMEELGALHKRIGDIGNGLSPPTPAPRQAQHAQQAQQVQQAQQAQAEPKAAAPKRGAPARDDETMVLEQPPSSGTGAKPTRRRVASSTR